MCAIFLPLVCVCVRVCVDAHLWSQINCKKTAVVGSDATDCHIVEMFHYTVQGDNFQTLHSENTHERKSGFSDFICLSEDNEYENKFCQQCSVLIDFRSTTHLT